MMKNLKFNHGFMCPNCGPIREAKKKTVNKVEYKACKSCDSIVKSWERPLNERTGRCSTCGAASFNAAMGKNNLRGHILRQCKDCGEVFDTDTMTVLRKGKMEG